MKKILIVSVCIFILFSCAHKTVKQKDMEKDRANLALLQASMSSIPSNERARSLLMEGKYKEALPLFEKSKDSESRLYAAVCKLNLGQIQQARKEFEALIAERKYIAEAKYNMALIHHELKETAQAYVLMKWVLNQNKKHPGANYYLGSYYYSKKQYEKSIGFFKAAVAAQPDNKASWDGLFYTFLALKQYQDAWDLREQLDKSNLDTIYNLMVVGEKVNRCEQALAFYKELKFFRAELDMQRVILLMQCGNVKEAFGAAKRLLKRNEELGFVIMDRGKTDALSYAIYMGRGDNATFMCKQGHEKIERDVSVVNNHLSIDASEYQSYREFKEALPFLCKY